MGKLGKSIQAGLWLTQYWKLTTTNSCKPPPPLAVVCLGASWPHLDTPILLFMWKDNVPFVSPVSILPVL